MTTPAAAFESLSPTGVITYTVTRRDLLQLAWVHPYWNKVLYATLLFTRAWGKVMKWLAKPVAVGVVSLCALVGLTVDPTTTLFVGGASLLLLPLFLAKLVAVLRLRRSLVPHGHAMPCQMHFSPEALHWRRGPEDAEIPWRGITLVYDLKGFYLLRSRWHGELLLPKRVLKDATDSHRFVAAVNHAIPERVKKWLPEYAHPPPRNVRERRQWAVMLLCFVIIGLVVFALLHKYA